MEFVSTINKIWPQINGQVTGYFSTALFDSFRQRGNQNQIAALAIGISLIYFIYEPIFRKPIKNFRSKNQVWNKVLDEFGNVYYRFFLFIIIQYANEYVKRGLNDTITTVSFFQRVVEIFSISFILVTIVSLMEYYGEIFKGEHTYTADSIRNFNRAYGGIYGVVIQFFATTFFDILRNLTTQQTAVIASISFFVSYLVFENIARWVIEYMDPKHINRPIWDKTLLGYLDFTYTFAIFLIIQYIGVFMSAQLSDNLSIFGEITAAFTIFITFYSAMAIVVDLTKYSKKEDTWFITDTTYRVWPKISGTVTGLIAAIFSDRLLVTENEQRVLLYLVLIILLYSLFDPVLRKIIKSLQTEQERESTWNAVVIEILDFLFSLGLLLFLNSFTDLIELEDAPIFQAAAIIISAQSILSTVLVIFREYEVEKKYSLN